MIHIRKLSPAGIIPAILTLCCAAAIFIFSMQSGDQSAKLSSGLLSHILAFVKGVPVSEITYEQLSKYSFLIRKAAHFTIFFTLGVFSCWTAWGFFRKRHMMLSLIFCVLYACTDELHQFFSEGRGPAVRDVLIDSAGAFAGVSITAFVIFLFTNGKNDSTLH
ncbi:MAG: VanZ family protein [Ruminococcus sp.]